MKYLFTAAILFLMTAAVYAQRTITDSSHRPVTTEKPGIVSNKDSIPYATFYFYRSFIPWAFAPLKKVPVYMNDTLIHKLKANTILGVKVFKEGKSFIAIDDDGKTEIPVKVIFGKEYFFKCEVKMGLMFGKPTIEAVTPAEGKADAGMLVAEK